MRIKESMGSENFPQLLFDKVYKDDITRLRSMEEMWKTRRRPEPLDYATILAKAQEGKVASKEKILRADQRAWTLEENVIIFQDRHVYFHLSTLLALMLYSLDRLSKRLQEMQATSNGSCASPIITFDKDDDDTLDFVTASANLRSIVFGIDTKSKFDIKQMAGNIIPAIATTNAIVAGLCVLQSFKVLRGDFSSTKEVSLNSVQPPYVPRVMSSWKPEQRCLCWALLHHDALCLKRSLVHY